MKYSPFSTICLRTPSFVFNQRDIDYINDFFEESVYIASPELYSEWCKNKQEEIKVEKQIEKLNLSLNKYYVRANSRCTPFGLFAGISGIEINLAEEIKIDLVSSLKYKRHTRLDMNYLCALAQDLITNQSIKSDLLFYPNTSILQIADKIRYVEYKYINSRRVHEIVSVDANEYLLKIIKLSENGSLLSQIAESIVDEDVSLIDATEFVNEIVNSQILVSELSPNVTGEELLPLLITRLKKIENQESKTIVDILTLVNNKLNIIDSSPIGTTISVYSEIAEELKKLGTDFEPKFLFQCDMVKPVISSSFNQKFIDDLNEAITVLNKLTLTFQNSNLNKFKDAFYERYEDCMIPLLHVLDPDSGIGYMQDSSSGDVNPLVDDLVLPYKSGNEYETKISKITSLLFNKVRDSIANNSTQIEITDKDLEGLKDNWDDLPPTFSAMVEHYGDTFSISSVGGTSAANLLGRFCHADSKTEELVNEITTKEKEYYKDTIVAEIVHLPESRIGNILMRPTIREYEIPYLAKSTLKEENQIQLQDLLVGVKNQKIIVWSKRLNKEIIPRLSTAHNYSYNALPIYQFLCDLQGQNIRSGFFINWSFISNVMNLMPRVTYKNAILSLAKWTVKKEDIQALAKAPDESVITEMEILRKTRNIPEQVVLADGDNELFINLKSLPHIKMLLSVVKNRPSFQLEEFLFNPETAVVKSDEGVFTNQMVFSFYKNSN
ncbi:MAG: lantibiotic dehydratase family protein [Bacteroidota bacterium]